LNNNKSVVLATGSIGLS